TLCPYTPRFRSRERPRPGARRDDRSIGPRLRALYQRPRVGRAADPGRCRGGDELTLTNMRIRPAPPRTGGAGPIKKEKEERSVRFDRARPQALAGIGSLHRRRVRRMGAVARLIAADRDLIAGLQRMARQAAA